jgi:hypothetical protein
MLFDLRGRGRRRTVQAIYLTLAVLMGGGLVFFGIGGNTSGGLLDAFKSNGGSSGSSLFQKRVKSAEKSAQAAPKDPKVWVSLARLRFQEVGAAEYNQATQSFTDKGKQQLSGVETAWNRYLALDPKKPDASTALLMIQAFGPSALNKPDKAVSAMEIVLGDRPPSTGLYGQYAQLAYQAGQTRKGDLAAKKAVSLAPKADREQVKAALESAKASASGAVGGGTSGGTSGNGSAPVTTG